jgi:hypothetical protein
MLFTCDHISKHKNVFCALKLPKQKCISLSVAVESREEVQLAPLSKAVSWMFSRSSLKYTFAMHLKVDNLCLQSNSFQVLSARRPSNWHPKLVS